MRCLTILFIFVVLNNSAIPAVVYVNKIAPAGGDGSTWPTAFNELENALISANSGDEIWIAQGTYTPDIAPNRTLNCLFMDPSDSTSRTFSLPDGISIYGGFIGTETTTGQRILDKTATILSGDFNGDDSGSNMLLRTDNASQVIVTDPITTSNIVIDNLTISGGTASHLAPFFGIPVADYAVGGGFLNLGDFISLHNVLFYSNAAADAGAALCSINGELSIDNCIFDNNFITADAYSDGIGCFVGVGGPGNGGAAIYFDSSLPSNSLTVANTDFTNNFTAIDDKGTGAIFIRHSTASFSNCNFINNYGGGVISGGNGLHQAGSALYTLDGVHIDNSLFQGNAGGSALYSDSHIGIINATDLIGVQFINNATVNMGPFAGTGGGVSLMSNGGLVSNCIFNGNAVSGQGGAIFSPFSPTITNCIFQNNTAWDGGAFYGAADISRSSFIGNQSSPGSGASEGNGFGGAVFVTGGMNTKIIDNSLMYNNNATVAGAVYVEGSSLNSIINCTLTNNTATLQTGGVFNAFGTPKIRNSILWGNTGPGSTLDDQISGVDSTLVNNTCLQDPASSFGLSGMIYSDPQFSDPLNADYRLKTNTPCRDVGDNNALDTNNDGTNNILFDLDLASRLQGGVDPVILEPIVDLGAYERCFGDYNNDGVTNFFDIALFNNDFAAGNLDADLNADGVLNFFDVSAIITLFGAGCI